MSRGLLIIDKTPGAGHSSELADPTNQHLRALASRPRWLTTLEQKRLTVCLMRQKRDPRVGLCDRPAAQTLGTILTRASCTALSPSVSC
jgi:hypothetical protein